MEKKRTGLRSYIRSNLPIELVKFLKKKRVLTAFIRAYLNCLSGYINPKEVFERSLKFFPDGDSLFIFIKITDSENTSYWYNLGLEYEPERTNSK